MKLQFLNRKKEINRLQQAINKKEPVFIVIYGRRRCGKSRLLQQLVTEKDIYFIADQQEKSLQIKSLSKEVARKVPSFDKAEYPSWEAFFLSLNNQLNSKLCLILDEFPYLVQSAPELPSIIQKMIDTNENKVNLIICGSSQKMMQELVINSNSPLYGRANEIIKISPLGIKWLKKALEINSEKTVEIYSVLGGVPRYWELAKDYSSFSEILKNIIFDKNGILHNEPKRLLLDDLRTTIQTNSLLALIANGCHRLSEIASRLNKPASSLTRPLANLIELGYIKRETPFEESIKSTKRSLYKLNDPFMKFWYRFVLPNQSLLEKDLISEVYNEFKNDFTSYVSEIWEDIARDFLPQLKLDNIAWKPGVRWWGNGINGKSMEIDLISESFDKKHLLFGEVKWSKNVNIKAIIDKLKYSSSNFPDKSNREIHYACWIKNKKTENKEITLITPDDIF